jgi:hypothetical protein
MTRTDYADVVRAISEFLECVPSGHVACVSRLRTLVRRHFRNLTAESNCIATGLPELSSPEVAFVLLDYSRWLRETIRLFMDMRWRIEFEGVQEEIDRNLEEELGATTSGVPHLQLMRRGFRSDLQLDTDTHRESPVTRQLLDSVRDIFDQAGQAFLCGALLAFEFVATEEFKVIQLLIQRRTRDIGGTLAPTSPVRAYVSAHIALDSAQRHPEDRHFEALDTAIGAYVGDKDRAEFGQGFLAVCFALETWWDALASEVLTNRARLQLRPTRQAGVSTAP